MGKAAAWKSPKSGLSHYAWRSRKSSGKHDDKGILTIQPHVVTEHVWDAKRVPSGFFDQPDCEQISAVLSSREATISKFNRMGLKSGFGSPRVRMVRVGTRYVPDANRAEPEEFTVRITTRTGQMVWRYITTRKLKFLLIRISCSVPLTISCCQTDRFKASQLQDSCGCPYRSNGTNGQRCGRERCTRRSGTVFGRPVRPGVEDARYKLPQAR